MTESLPLIGQVRRALEDARRVYEESPAADRIAVLEARLVEPLRVAIAGRVKAGKSTLLNALVGEELAPTDAGECTRIVTWYQHGRVYRVSMQLRTGETIPVRFERDGGPIVVDLAGRATDDVARLIIEWPTQALREITLIDTPGIAAASAETSGRAWDFLAPSGEEPAEADAVIYLMRHLHSEDVRFLEAFHDDELSGASPINAVAVLSRADEIGASRLNAMATAQRIAGRYRADPKIRRLCQTVVPIIGLLAETGVTLTQSEYDALMEVASVDRAELDEALLSTDRFVRANPAGGLTPLERQHLLLRLGMFGIRLSTVLLRQRVATTAGDLAEELVAESGLHELRDVLLTRFAGRRDVLKARSALLALEHIVEDNPGPTTDSLSADLERIRAGAHEFVELQLLNALHTGAIELSPDQLAEAERLVGVHGTSATTRLGLESDATSAEIIAAAYEAIEWWRRVGENPFSSKGVREGSQALVRTCEGLLADASPSST